MAAVAGRSHLLSDRVCEPDAGDDSVGRLVLDKAPRSAHLPAGSRGRRRVTITSQGALWRIRLTTAPVVGMTHARLRRFKAGFVSAIAVRCGPLSCRSLRP